LRGRTREFEPVEALGLFPSRRVKRRTGSCLLTPPRLPPKLDCFPPTAPSNGLIVMMQLTPAFPSFLAVDTLDIDINSIERYCYDLMKRDAGRKVSNDGGYQSNDLNFDLESPFKALFQQIEERVNSLHSSLMLKKSLKQKIDNAWFNVNKRGDYNIPHVHPRTCFSGVFYVKTPKDCGDLFLRNPASSLEHVIGDICVEQYNMFTAPSLRVLPEAKKLVIFPSWILHYVTANQSNSDRISIAFNTIFQRSYSVPKTPS
jgi:uncharacterized protein (TIGR02466 family)